MVFMSHKVLREGRKVDNGVVVTFCWAALKMGMLTSPHVSLWAPWACLMPCSPNPHGLVAPHGAHSDLPPSGCQQDGSGNGAL